MTYALCATAGAVAGLVGVLLGGGLNVVRDASVRRAEAHATASAIDAEVAALIGTIEARGLLAAYRAVLAQVEAAIAAGDNETRMAFPRIAMTWNYFAVFDALLPKIGLLPPARAGLVVRFYVAARSSSEMLMKRPGSTDVELSLHQLAGQLRTELRLADRVVALGREIVRTGRRPG